MAKKEAAEYRALVSDEGDIVRGRIPTPLVREIGARAGDYVVFRSSGTGNWSVSVERGKAKKAAKSTKGTKKATAKTNKKK